MVMFLASDSSVVNLITVSIQAVKHSVLQNRESYHDIEYAEWFWSEILKDLQHPILQSLSECFLEIRERFFGFSSLLWNQSFQHSQQMTNNPTHNFIFLGNCSNWKTSWIRFREQTNLDEILTAWTPINDYFMKLDPWMAFGVHPDSFVLLQYGSVKIGVNLIQALILLDFNKPRDQCKGEMEIISDFKDRWTKEYAEKCLARLSKMSPVILKRDQKKDFVLVRDFASQASSKGDIDFYFGDWCSNKKVSNMDALEANLSVFRMDTRGKVQCAMVRIMKQRQTMQVSDLIDEVKVMTRGTVLVDHAEVDALVGRGFFCYLPGDQNVVIYES